MTGDPFHLHRFVEAQASCYQTVLQEIRSGQKQSHWMWFIFPQMAGLGSSAMAQTYALHSRDEAAAYLAHPLLGPRLLECTQAVLEVENCSAHQIFGSPDDLKLRSSMTLFANVSADNSIFHHVLQRYYGGDADQQTRTLLATATTT